MESLTRSATTSANSVRIISIPPVPLAPIAPRLRLCSFGAGSAFHGTSTNAKMMAKEWFLYPGSSLKHFFGRISVTPGLSWILSGVRSNKTLSTNRKKSRIGLLTTNSFNPFSSSLTLTAHQKSPTSFDSPKKGSKPLIKAQLEQRGRELNSWDKLVEIAINAKAKASLQPTSISRKLDQHCLQGNRPAHTITEKAQTQDKLSQSLHSHSLRPKNGETSDKRAQKKKQHLSSMSELENTLVSHRSPVSTRPILPVELAKI